MFFLSRSLQQVASLPLISLDGRIRILLVTSRRRGRWILPKGWPKKGLSLADTAVLEAREEAGVVGIAHAEPVGSYKYEKRMEAGYRVWCHVFVYPILVQAHLVDWPERALRTVKWVSVDKAATLLDDDDLADLVADWQEDRAEELHDIAAELQRSLGDEPSFLSNPEAVLQDEHWPIAC